MLERECAFSVASMHCGAETLVRQSAVKPKSKGCKLVPFDVTSNNKELGSGHTLPYTVPFWSSSASTVILCLARVSITTQYSSGAAAIGKTCEYTRGKVRCFKHRQTRHCMVGVPMLPQ